MLNAATVSLGEVMSPGGSKLAAIRGFKFKGFALTKGGGGANIKIHGNSLKSPKKTWFYKLYSQDGTFLKSGITSKLVPETRYTKAFMEKKYMDNVVLFPNRLKAYNFEHEMNKILQGPLNLNMH